MRSLTRRLPVALAVAATLAVMVSVASEAGSKSPDVLAYALVIGIGGLVLVPDRPRWALFGSMALIVAYHALDYPAIGTDVAMAVPLFLAARAGLLLASSLLAAALVLGSSLWLVIADSLSVVDVIGGLATREVAMMAAVILAGYAVRSRQQLAEEVAVRLSLAEAERAARAEERVATERLAMARELHDVVAHTVAVVGVHARLGLDALDDDPAATRRALSVIVDASRDATAELGATVRMLRSPDERQPVPLLADIPALVDRIGVGGPIVDLRVDPDLPPLPGSIQVAGYRLVQEALTNVVRHADASMVRISVTREGTELGVSVLDDGVGGIAEPGFGLSGIRERVEASGGILTAEPHADGFAVTARFPLEAD